MCPTGKFYVWIREQVQGVRTPVNIVLAKDWVEHLTSPFVTFTGP